MARKKAQQVDTSNIEIIDEPGAWKWIVGFGFATVLGGALHAIDLFGSSLYSLRLHQDLSSRLAAAETLSEVVDDQQFAPLLKTKDSQLRALKSVHAFLLKDELEKAAAALKQPAIRNLEAKAALEESITALAAARASITAAEKAAEEAKQTVVGLNSQFALAASRFARSLQLHDLSDSWQEAAAQSASGEGSAFKVAFYQEGVFAGLPVLEGIPDAIADYRAVAPHLQTVNAASLGRSLAWSKSQVRQDLVALESDSRQLAGLIEESQAAQMRHSAAQQAATEQLAAIKNEFKATTAAIIAGLARPELSAQALHVYAFVRQQSKGILGELPAAENS